MFPISASRQNTSDLKIRDAEITLRPAISSENLNVVRFKEIKLRRPPNLKDFPLIWTGLVWATLGVVDPTLQQRVSWPWFVLSQVAFGIAADVVILRVGKVRTIQSLPLAVRAEIEAPGVEDDADTEDDR